MDTNPDLSELKGKYPPPYVNKILLNNFGVRFFRFKAFAKKIAAKGV